MAFQSCRISYEASFFQPIINNNDTINTITNNCHLRPTIITWRGIINKIVSRSSNMANTCTFLYTQVDFNPAAANIVNKIPAEVGAANRLRSKFSFHASESNQY
ncbi:MAG: hypothetical protein BWY47_02004 [Bacteroidetes bacterium ADurb.Bin302]|nr:MAG: hypothetical protein BWY47_02004 [Bacteroidetes bacterium ADurb.Bin302]